MKYFLDTEFEEKPDQKIVLQLQMRHKNHDSVCTGTLISERVILTAAPYWGVTVFKVGFW